MPSTALNEPRRASERNRLFTALSDERRRCVLRVLRRHRETDLSDLARDVVARERWVPVEEVPGSEASTVRVELYHCHVPVLADAGLVRYDEERDEVAVTRRGLAVVDTVDELLPVRTQPHR